MKKYLFFLLTIIGSLDGAAIHILDGLNYENPAALNRVKKGEIILGDLYSNPKFIFKGTCLGETGTARSNCHDHLPYGEFAYRLCDKLVYGFACVEYKYANINYGNSSVLRFIATQTKLTGRRFANRFSYQITKDLALGFAIDANYVFDTQINFVVPGLGNLKNKSKSQHVYWGFDFGFMYNINEKTILNVAAYIDRRLKILKGKSTSQSGLSNDDYKFHAIDCSEFYVQVIRVLDEKWLVAGKAVFSNWNVQRNIVLNNTVAGDFSFPAHWHNVWTFEGYGQYKFNNCWTAFGIGQYATNFATHRLNAPGYPGSGASLLAGGVTYHFTENLSMKFLYGILWYTPKARIDNETTNGRIGTYINIIDIGITYAW